jgi:membrane protease YdiL (CAAX protease family)
MPSALLSSRSPLWVDLAVVSPVFVLYHLGVLFVPLRNAADWVTRELIELAQFERGWYVLLTLGLALGYAGLVALLRRGQALRPRALLVLAFESALHAAAMRTGAQVVVGKLGLQLAVPFALAVPAAQPNPADLWNSTFGNVVMSLGAGLYEELGFRVLLFGLGGTLLSMIVKKTKATARATAKTFWNTLTWVGWALATSALFSAWHHTGSLGEPFSLQAFVFRTVCGLWFCGLYAFRGLAVSVWTHALYDIWVMVF